MKPRMNTDGHGWGREIVVTTSRQSVRAGIVSAVRSQLARVRIMQSAIAQFVRRHPVVSALRRQSSNRQIFRALRGQIAGGQIVHALRAQFSGRRISYAVRRRFAATVARQFHKHMELKPGREKHFADASAKFRHDGIVSAVRSQLASRWIVVSLERQSVQEESAS